MPYLDNRVYDNGLGVLNAEANRLVLCSQEPTTFTQANVTYKLGEKVSPTVATPTNKSGGGREVIVSAITDGSVTTTGTASHFALIDTTNSRLLAAQALNASQAVTALNDFTLTSLTVGIPGVA